MLPAKKNQLRNPRIFVMPFIYICREKSEKWLRDQYLEQYFEYQNYSETKESTYNVFHRPSGKPNIDEILNFIWSVNEDNCK